jgi:prepilin-type N-terminal cleavage/methylation domain-containing protein
MWRRGFTLIELLVVLAILALMLTIAAPRYIDHVERSREVTLKASLKVMREALDKFEADVGRPAASLEELVERRYISSIPIDPITDRRDTWLVVSSTEMSFQRAASASNGAVGPAAAVSLDAPDGVADVRSGAAGTGRDGRPFSEW